MIHAGTPTMIASSDVRVLRVWVFCFSVRRQVRRFEHRSCQRAITIRGMQSFTGQIYDDTQSVGELVS